MSEEHPLTFGVEIEMLLMPREHTPGVVRYDLVNRIADYHNSKFNTPTDLKMQAVLEDGGTTLKDGHYTKWGLLNDGTIIPGRDSGLFPMELVSPILDFSQGGDWRNHIRKAFRSVEAITHIDTNISCGTHVHIAPGRGVTWTADELRNIAHAILFFEGAFLELVPESRRVNVNCKSHSYELSSGNPGTVQPKESWGRLQHARIEDIIDMMCPSDRFFSWNFHNLLPSTHPHYDPAHCNGHTLEFRLAPGVTTAEGCLMWVELAVNFVQAARRPDAHTVLVNRRKRAVEDLRQFIVSSMGDDLSKMRYLQPALQNKSGRCLPSEWRQDRAHTEKDEPDEQRQKMLADLREEDNPWAQ